MKPKYEIVFSALRDGIEHRHEVLQFFPCKGGDVPLEQVEVRARIIFEHEAHQLEVKNRGTIVEKLYHEGNDRDFPHWYAVPVGVDCGIRVHILKYVFPVGAIKITTPGGEEKTALVNESGIILVNMGEIPPIITEQVRGGMTSGKLWKDGDYTWEYKTC